MDDDSRYGHQRMTDQLQIKGCAINHKKVHFLMKEHNLLHPKQKRTERNYVKYRIIAPTHRLSHLEMDIKFIWIEQSFHNTLSEALKRQHFDMLEQLESRLMMI